MFLFKQTGKIYLKDNPRTNTENTLSHPRKKNLETPKKSLSMYPFTLETPFNTLFVTPLRHTSNPP